MPIKDVMTTPALSVAPDALVKDIAALLFERRIGVVPALDADDRRRGVSSEGSFVGCAESDTEHLLSRGPCLLDDPQDNAVAHRNSQGGQAGDAMTREVVSAGEDATPEDVASLLAKHCIKRAAVLDDVKLPRFVSCAERLHRSVARRETAAASAVGEAISVAVQDAPSPTGVLLTGGIIRRRGATGGSSAIDQGVEL